MIHFILKSQRILCVSFSRIDSQLCIYHLFVWLNLNFLHNSQWITLLTQLCQVLKTLSSNLLHSLNMWLIVSPLSPYNLHLLFWCVLSILALTESLWHCFVLLSEEIQFFSWGFLFFAISKFTRCRFRLFVVGNIHAIVFLPIFAFRLFLFCWCLCCLHCFCSL